MKRLPILLTLLVIPLYAIDVPLYDAGSPVCYVTSATNATPIVLSVTGPCSLANDDIIIVDKVRGNLGANIHVISPSDSDDIVRVVKGKTGTNPCTSGCTIQLYDGNSTPAAVPGTGTYTGGGMIGHVTWRTLKSGPIGFFNGTGGNITTGVASKAYTSAGGESAITSKAATAAANQKPEQFFSGNFQGAYMAAAALGWYMDGGSTNLTAAKYFINNFDFSIGTPACSNAGNITNVTCWGDASSIGDWPTQFSGTALIVAFNLMKGQLSNAEIDNLNELMFADEPWTRGGFDYSGSARTVVAYKVLPGDTSRINITGTSLTCASGSCLFQTRLIPGDVILPTNGSSGTPRIIASIASETSATLDSSFAGNVTSNPWIAGPRWVPGTNMMGWAYHRNHESIASLSGGVEGPPYNDNSHPFFGNGTGEAANGFGNRGIVYRTTWFGLGISLCNSARSDPRACLVASRAWFDLHAEVVRYALTIHHGTTQSNSSYHHNRNMTSILYGACIWARNSFTTDPTWTTVCDSLAMAYGKNYIASVLPGGTFKMIWSNGGGSVTSNASIFTNAAYAVPAWFNDTTNAISRAISWVHVNRTPGLAGTGMYTGDDNYLEVIPNYDQALIAAATAPTFKVIQTADLDSLCAPVYGTTKCTEANMTNKAQDIAVSDWTSTATTVEVDWSGYSPIDHNQVQCGPSIRAWVGATPLISGDNANDWGGTEGTITRSIIQVGAVTNFPTYSGPGYGVPRVATAAWRTTDPTNTAYMFGRYELPGYYNTGTPISTGSYRQTAYLTVPNLLVVFDNVLTTSSQTIQSFWHFKPSVGGPTSSGDFNLSRASKTMKLTASGGSNRTVDMKWFCPLGATTCAVTTENASNVNLSYASGGGVTGRVAVTGSTDGSTSAATTNYQAIAVARLGTSAISLPTTTVNPATTSGYYVVQVDDPTNGGVVVLTAGTGTVSDLDLGTTTHAGTVQYVVSGLSAGTYQFKRNGTTVCSGVVVAAGDQTLGCQSAAGAITMTAAGSYGGSRVGGGGVSKGGGRIN